MTSRSMRTCSSVNLPSTVNSAVNLLTALGFGTYALLLLVINGQALFYQQPKRARLTTGPSEYAGSKRRLTIEP
eukprot:scaffold30850_cov73-Phaeocystis_antarctica.AAC.10